MMKLCTVLLLVLPLACFSFSPPRKSKNHTLEIAKEGPSSLKDTEITFNTSDTEISPHSVQAQKNTRPVVVVVKGRRKWKKKWAKKRQCRKGVKSKKCRRWARKQARKQRRIRRRLAAAAKRIQLEANSQLTPANPPIEDLCRRLNGRGIEDSALHCAEINDVDVDTFMDFVLLVLSNSSINGPGVAYPEDEQEQFKSILSCLGNRKRWHRTNDLDEVLTELRVKESFSSIGPCVEEVGRNCSWSEEEASSWLLCVNLKCKEQRQTSRSQLRWPQFEKITTDASLTSTAKTPGVDDDYNSILTEELQFENLDDKHVGPMEDSEKVYHYDYRTVDMDYLTEEEE